MTDYIVEDIWEFQSLPATLAADARIWAGNARMLGSGVAREGLSFRLKCAHLSPLTLINAPAGYGKTSLLRQWADELSSAGYQPLYITVARDGATVTRSAHRQRAAIQLDNHDALLPFICNWLDTRARGVVLIDDGHSAAGCRCAGALHVLSADRAASITP